MKRFSLSMGVGCCVVMMGLLSCGRKGCTDLDAINFSANARNDDGSCVYSGKVLFWYNSTVVLSLMNSGITSLKFYIGNELKYEGESIIYWNQVPDCGHAGTITLIIDMGELQMQPVNYLINDQNGNAVWEGVVSLVGGLCNPVQLSL